MARSAAAADEGRTSYSLVSLASVTLLNNASRHAAWLKALSMEASEEACRHQHTGSGPAAGAPEEGASIGLWRWKPHELEIVARAVRELPVHTSPEDTKRLLAELGWPLNDRTKTRLRNKMARLRARVSHGVNPEDLLSRKRLTRDAGPSFKPWIIKALQAIPEGQGTADEIGAVLLADPVIGPLLDCRLAMDRRAPTPQWRITLANNLDPRLGFFNTGQKREGRVVYGYEPQAGAAAKHERTCRKGRAGLPHLGKQQ